MFNILKYIHRARVTSYFFFFLEMTYPNTLLITLNLFLKKVKKYFILFIERTLKF